jgi:Leucine-rich repeat (LRR) protein
LVSLDLGKNLLPLITNQTLVGLDNLASLDLSDNKLEVLDESMLNQLFSLEKLFLNGNAIKSVDEKVFTMNVFLTNVHIEANPFTDFFKNNTLDGLYNLKYLQLPSQIEFNREINFIIKSSINIQYITTVLEISYYRSIEIVTFNWQKSVRTNLRFFLFSF